MSPILDRLPRRTVAYVVGGLIAVAILVVVASGTSRAASVSANPPQSAEQAAEAKFEGFRSALFGMSKAEVLTSIRNDFGIGKEKIKEQENEVERTTALWVVVDDLLPDVGPGQVTYIFGFKTRKLISVNVTWGHPVHPDPDPQKLVSSANMLRNHFAQQRVKPEGKLLNARLEDGSIIVFRGVDSKSRMVVLLLHMPKEEKKPDEAADREKKEQRLKKMSLRLSYIHDPERPDVFHLGKDKF